MELAAILLGITALGGATLAGIRFLGKPRPPTWLAVGHGVLAISGLYQLGATAYRPGIPILAEIAFGGMILAAVGGAILFFGFHLRGHALPIPLVIGHGLLALIGYAVLLVSVFLP